MTVRWGSVSDKDRPLQERPHVGPGLFDRSRRRRRLRGTAAPLVWSYWISWFQVCLLAWRKSLTTAQTKQQELPSRLDLARCERASDHTGHWVYSLLHHYRPL